MFSMFLLKQNICNESTNRRILHFCFTKLLHTESLLKSFYNLSKTVFTMFLTTAKLPEFLSFLLCLGSMEKETNFVFSYRGVLVKRKRKDFKLSCHFENEIQLTSTQRLIY